MTHILAHSFYERSTVHVAQELLGCILVREVEGKRLSGMIVETEGYTSDDPACHAFKGKTTKNASLFGPSGHAYVYFSYGIHWCLNTVAHDKNVPAGGVLIRAVQPLDGIEFMQANRGKTMIKELTTGPGKLTQAFGITKKFDGYDLTLGKELWIEQPAGPRDFQMQATSRLGISVGTELQWRFIIQGNAFVSRK